MSHFVFGRIYQKQPHEDRDREVLGIARATRNVGLFGRFDKDICQNVVNEMLSKQVIRGTILCEFLLTASEKDDTSDSIISPYCLKEGELIKSLSRVEQWTTDLLRLFAIARMDLYITEGYDDSFKTIYAVGLGWGKRLAETVHKENYVESICLQLLGGWPKSRTG